MQMDWSQDSLQQTALVSKRCKEAAFAVTCKLMFQSGRQTMSGSCYDFQRKHDQHGRQSICTGRSIVKELPSLSNCLAHAVTYKETVGMAGRQFALAVSYFNASKPSK
jgi:hypothetical protein